MNKRLRRVPTWLTVDMLVIVISLVIIGIGIGVGIGIAP